MSMRTAQPGTPLQPILPDRLAPGSAPPNQAGEKNGVTHAADGLTQKGQPVRLPFLLVIYRLCNTGSAAYAGSGSGRDNLDRIGMHQHFGSLELAVDCRFGGITEFMRLLQGHVGG